MDIFAPVNWFAKWLTYDIFRIQHESLLGEAVSFFVFDTIKVFMLLIAIIFVVSYLRTYLPPEKVRFFISKRNKITGHIMAAAFGIITPFCTCSAIPLFLGFLEAGVPLGVTFSFLIASPMINEVALVMLLGMFGWKVALIYIASGMIIAIVSGLVIGQLKVENLVQQFGTGKKACACAEDGMPLKAKDRASYAWSYVVDVLKKVWPFIVGGIAVGAWIHGYVPVDFMAKIAGGNNWWAVPVATLIGIPLYSNAAGIIPLVSVLTEKGVSLGTTLAFMMAVTGLSLPEFLILRTVMKTKLILIFAGIVGIGIILTGYLFNAIL
ncbi:MAG TPA: permease [Caldisericia bacterium]|nr:permease [Caldisericia bacterium]HOU08415.1 permease [Caldisericia bacterium]HPL89234.1 permease [Caldisericia bacterium]HQG60206.1 permease [Caldisericia bacterium]HQH48578.1 permease [Caldisericia bacterium]